MFRRPTLAALAGVALLSGTTQASPPLAYPTVDHILVHKAARTMTLYGTDGSVTVIDRIQLGGDPVGPKHFEGDRRTPEGRFTIDYGNPNSAYHLALHVSYPRASDTAYAAARGRGAGGLIMIHGQPNDWPPAASGQRVPGDWTDGCIALSDEQIEALWQAVPDGTPIEIVP